MKSHKAVFTSLIVVVIASIACSNVHKMPDVRTDIRRALDEAGLTSVSVTQDREKNVVTLGGTVPSEDDKQRAESIAKSIAGTAEVADWIGIRPAGKENRDKKVTVIGGKATRTEKSLNGGGKLI